MNWDFLYTYTSTIVRVTTSAHLLQKLFLAKFPKNRFLGVETPVRKKLQGYEMGFLVCCSGHHYYVPFPVIKPFVTNFFFFFNLSSG